MPNPKRRHSKARRDRRRAHDHLQAPGAQRVPELPRAEAAAPRVPACGTTRARRSPGARRSECRSPGWPWTPWAATTAPRWWWRGPCSPAASWAIRCPSSGPGRRVRAELQRARATPAPSRSWTRPTSSGMGEKVSLSTLKKRSSIQVGARARARRRGRRLLLGGQHRGVLDDRQDRARHARGGGPAGPGRGGPEPQGAHRAPRRGRQRAVQGPPPRGVRRSWAAPTRAGSSTSSSPRVGPHEHGRGGDEGQRRSSGRSTRC